MSETDFSPEVDNVQLVKLIANQARQHTSVVKDVMESLENANPQLRENPTLKNLVQQYVGLEVAEKLGVNPELIVPPQQETQTGHVRLRKSVGIGVRKTEVFTQIKKEMSVQSAQTMRYDIEQAVKELTAPILAEQSRLGS